MQVSSGAGELAPGGEGSRGSFLRIYDRILGAIDAVVSKVIIAAMAGMSLVLLLQVFYRYFLNDSVAWGWDIPRLCFIAVVLLAIPLGIRYNAHVGIDLVYEQLGPRAKRFVRMFNAFFMLVLSAAVAYYASRLANDTWDQMMPGIGLSVGLFYVALAVGQIHSCLHIARILITGEMSTEHWGEE